MRHITRLVGISLVTLLFCSIVVTSTSAATYTYGLTVAKGAYTKYECTFSNATNGLFKTGSTMSYYVAEVNMSCGYTISYANDTHEIEGALFVFYVNNTLFDWVSSGFLDPPLSFLITPTSDAWWSLLKSYAENLSVYNRVTISSDMVDITWFSQHDGINETYTGSMDKDTGVIVSFRISSLNVTSHQTQVTYVQIIETNIPNVNTAPQPISTIMIVGVAGTCAAVGLVTGLLIGRRRA